MNWREVTGKRGKALQSVTTVGTKAWRPRSRTECVRKPLLSCSMEAGAQPWGAFVKCLMASSLHPQSTPHPPLLRSLAWVTGLYGLHPEPLILGIQQNVVLASPQVLPVTD